MTTQYTANFQLALPDFRSGPWHDLVNTDFARIDALLYSAMSQGNVAPWTNATLYTAGITVIDNSDASVWVCAIGHTSAALPTTFLADRTAHPSYWARLLTGFAPRGEWARNTQYFPYDLAYDSARGIMALCETIHISTSTGSILDDSAHWAFLLDMSDVGTIIASAVTYSNTASGIPPTNVQNAVDYLQSEVVSLNNVNVTQGTQISNLGSVNNTQDTRLTALEGKTTFTGALTAPYYISAASNVQFGGSPTAGITGDGTNLLLRVPGSAGATIFQNPGGSVNYGFINSTGLNVTGVVTASGQVSGSSFYTATGTATLGGRVLYLNAAQSIYLYYNGAAHIVLQGVHGYSSIDGQFWGTANHSQPVENFRLVFLSDDVCPGASPTEPYGGGVITGMSAPVSLAYNVARFRQAQVYYSSAGWQAVGYA